MKFNIGKIGTLALVMLILTSGIAAAATFDSETTSTATTSDISGTSTTVALDPGNSSEQLYVETDGASTSNLTLELTPAQSGVDYVAYSNASPVTENSSAGHYSWTVTHDELEDLPRDYAGGTYNATVINQSDGSTVLQTEVTFDTSGTDDNAVMVVSDDAGSDGAAMTNLVADRLDVESQDAGWLSKAAFWSESSSENITTWTGYTKVNGTSSSITVDLANSTTADAYANAAADHEDGEWIQDATVQINGVPYKVHKNSADTNGTAVVYNENTEQLEISLGSEHDGVETVSIRSTANDGYGYGEILSNFGAVDALKSLGSDLNPL